MHMQEFDSRQLKRIIKASLNLIKQNTMADIIATGLMIAFLIHGLKTSKK